jgi:hypothetical protein
LPPKLAALPARHVADGLQAGAFQRMLDRAIEVERRDGKRSDRLRFLSRRCNRTIGVARERACGSRGSRQRRLNGKTLRFERGRDAAEQHTLAAEKRRCARHVEQQPMRQIESDQRRVAVAPIGDRFEQRAIRVLVGFDDFEIGNHRARIGEHHAGGKIRSRRLAIDRGQTQRAVDLRHDNKRSPLRSLREHLPRKRGRKIKDSALVFLPRERGRSGRRPGRGGML